MQLSRIVVACLGTLAIVAAASLAAAPVPVMLLDGESGGPYHDWQHVTPVLKKILDETGLFTVTVVTAPAATGELTTFAPEFGKYKAVVMNYDAPDERWPASIKASFEQYMQKGGGLRVGARGRQRVRRMDRVQRDDRRRRLAQPDRAGRTELVRPRRQSRVGHGTREGRQSRSPRAVQDHGARCESSDREGTPAGVDASR